MVDSDILYGMLSYGVDTTPEEGLEPYIPNLMKYLPECYHELLEMQAVQGANAKETGAFRYAMDDLLNQCFIQTATWGLDIWERELGLTTDVSKAYERRREVIIAKLRGAGTTTKEMIRRVATAFSGGDVEVIEYPAEHRFEVQFVGTMGIPPNMEGLIQAIEEIKPSHLAYSFKYTYTWWDTVKNLTWDQTKMKTWNELRVYEGV